jgi:hypothetical protein
MLATCNNISEEFVLEVEFPNALEKFIGGNFSHLE